VRKTKTSYEKSRLKDLLWLLIQQSQPDCYLCHAPFTKSDVLPSRGSDQLTEHHKDGNHSNNDLSNRVLAHRVCHKRYHVKDNIHSEDKSFWRQFNG